MTAPNGTKRHQTALVSVLCACRELTPCLEKWCVSVFPSISVQIWDEERGLAIDPGGVEGGGCRVERSMAKKATSGLFEEGHHVPFEGGRGGWMGRWMDGWEDG